MHVGIVQGNVRQSRTSVVRLSKLCDGPIIALRVWCRSMSPSFSIDWRGDMLMARSRVACMRCKTHGAPADDIISPTLET